MRVKIPNFLLFLNQLNLFSSNKKRLRLQKWQREIFILKSKPYFRSRVAFFADFLSAPVGAVGPLCWVVAAAWVADKHRCHPPRTMEWTWTTIGAFSSRVRRDIPLHLRHLTAAILAAFSLQARPKHFSPPPVFKNTFAPKCSRS